MFDGLPHPLYFILVSIFVDFVRCDYCDMHAHYKTEFGNGVRTAYYCKSGCCGVWPLRFCCDISTTDIVGATLGGLAAASALMIACCCCGRRNIRARRVVRPIGTTAEVVAQQHLEGPTRVTCLHPTPRPRENSQRSAVNAVRPCSEAGTPREVVIGNNHEAVHANRPRTPRTFTQSPQSSRRMPAKHVQQTPAGNTCVLCTTHVTINASGWNGMEVMDNQVLVASPSVQEFDTYRL